jgi:hypothetical protein
MSLQICTAARSVAANTCHAHKHGICVSSFILLELHAHVLSYLSLILLPSSFTKSHAHEHVSCRFILHPLSP